MNEEEILKDKENLESIEDIKDVENKENLENIEDTNCEGKEAGSYEKQKDEDTSQTKEDEPSAEQLIANLEKELSEEKDKYLRVHADFENIKKRLEREKYQAIDYASEKFAKDLLAPIDTLELALKSSTADLEPSELLEKLKEGLNLTLKNFQTVFDKHDITEVETDGEFDPNIHNGVMHVPSEKHEDGQIVEKLQKGYKIKDRLLRPAMVSICKNA